MAGIYIHIPFCRQACHYCDFHFSVSEKHTGDMIEMTGRELILRKDYLAGETIETIYFGGGTPSLISSDQIKFLLNTIRNEYKVSDDIEITLEANPDDLTRKKSDELINSGINRLSIGIQSFADDDLRFMNRAHNSEQAILSVENSKAAGFNNLSIDLIYGVPVSPTEQWKRNIETALSLEVDHLSCYALTIEPKTALADMIRKKKVSAPDDEKTSSEFEMLIKKTADAGFEHYEISNFARDKKYSRHNTSYWQRKKYLGAGPSAHSYDGETRQWNVSNNQLYINSLKENIIPSEKEVLTIENKFNEYILTSLRTMWGTDIQLIENEFGREKKENLAKQLDAHIKNGLIIFSENVFKLTDKGRFFADGIAGSLFI